LRLFLAFLAVALVGASTLAAAQDARDAQEATQEAIFKTEELDQMLAPIALYPDELLANILMASTYPLDVVQAARWRKEPANAKLKDEALTKALEEKNWDPSIKALTMFPDVLQNMSDKLDWTQQLGDAFLAQEDDVFARVQYLRQKADEAGNLKTTKQQKVTKQPDPETRTEYIVIEPAEPDVVYVPVYQPTVVYGSWWYPSYPPYYWNPYPGASFVNGFFWGAGFAVANNIWGWNRCDWRRGSVDIDINRYNNINVNRAKISSNTWEHNARHRGPVPYRDKATREKYAKDRKIRDKNKDFSGFDKSKVGDRGDVDRVKDKLGDRDGSKAKDKVGDRDLSKAKDKVGDRDLSKAKDKVGDRDLSKAKDKVGDRDISKAKDKVGDRAPSKAKDKVGSGKSKPATKNIKKSVKKSPKASSKAMNVKPKSQVKKQTNRGNVSRKSSASHPKARKSGGGAKRGGGGGGRKGGGGGRRR
jgi:uncharacterized membrane protein YgcG